MGYEVGCENSFLLRNQRSSAKLKMTFNIPLFFIYTGHLSFERVSKGGNAIAAVCSSPCPSLTAREPPIIFSGHHFQPNFDSPIWREPEEPNELRNDFAKDGRFHRDMLISQRLRLGCKTVSQRSANFAEAAKSRRGYEIS